jgi:hypothetical protein
MMLDINIIVILWTHYLCATNFALVLHIASLHLVISVSGFTCTSIKCVDRLCVYKLVLWVIL